MGKPKRFAAGALLFCALFSPACARTAPEDDALAPDAARTSHVSGSRLRARVVKADGAVAFLGWFDTGLGISCELQRAEDGVFRCLPRSSYAQVSEPFDCGARVMADLPLPTPDPSAVCANAGFVADSAVYGRREIRDGASAGRCEWAGSSGIEIHRKGGPAPSPRCGEGMATAEHVPASDFVGARFEDVDGGGRLMPRYAVFDDGARQLVAFVDRRSNVECRPFGALLGDESSDTICAPSGNAWLTGEYFTACEGGDELAYSPLACNAPPFVAVSPHAGCRQAEIRSVAEAVAPSAVSSRILDRCSPAKDDRHYFRAGPVVARDAFAVLTIRPMGSGRLRARVWSEADGTSAGRVGLLHGAGSIAGLGDRELGTCKDARRIGGVTRCVPETAHEGSLFTDDGCTEPATSTSDFCGEPSTPPSMIVVRTSECDSELRNVEAWSGALFRRDGEACVPFEPTTREGFRAYRATTPIAPERLAPVTFEQE